jgi:hypothetical protein
MPEHTPSNCPLTNVKPVKVMRAIYLKCLDCGYHKFKTEITAEYEQLRAAHQRDVARQYSEGLVIDVQILNL